jgi:hypothetical protein
MMLKMKEKKKKNRMKIKELLNAMNRKSDFVPG